MMKGHIFLILFFLLILFAGCEKEPSSAISQWRYYNMIESPGNYVTCIAIDKNNNKWIGTKNGLVKFDGKEWTYKFNIDYKEQDNYIKCIAVDPHDPNGKIFIGTIAGLTVYDAGNDTSVNYAYRYGTIIRDSLYYVNCITIDNTDTVWVATNWGLGKVISSTNIIEGIPDPGDYPFDLLSFDGYHKNIWTGYHDLRITRYKQHEKTWDYPFKLEFGNYYQKCMTNDSLGNIWVGVDGVTDQYTGILMKLRTNSTGQDTSYVYAPSDGSSVEVSILMSEGKAFWVGTPQRSQEVNILKFDIVDNHTINITKYSNSNFSTLFRSTSIAIDKFGNKWIGSEQGVFVFNENGVTLH